MPEITESYIHLPVHNKTEDDTDIITITISKDKGIKALYSIKRKKILTLLFSTNKKFNWTIKKAKDWKESHSFAVEATLGHESMTSGYDISDKYEQIITFVLENGFKLKFN